MSRDVIKHIISRHVAALQDGVPSRNHALIIGPTGCGKTHTIKKELEVYPDIPFICVSATTITREGWVGMSLQDIFGDMKQEHLERAIIYVDEIDKLRRSKDDHGHSEGMQTEFLEYLDGGHHLLSHKSQHTKDYIRREVNFDNITFIFSGAFMDLWDKKEKNKIGFNNKKDVDISTIHEKLIDYGFIKEFIYRVPIVTQLEAYTRAELRPIIETNFELYRLEKRFGVNIDREDMLDFITKHPAGARAMQLYLAEQDVKNFIRQEEARKATKISEVNIFEPQRQIGE